MAGERTLPGLGLTGFWDLGDNTYKTGLDSNLRTLSAVAGGSAKSRVTALPASGALGDIYLVRSDAGATANNVAIWDGAAGAEAWVYLPAVEGLKFWVVDESKNYQFVGSSWSEVVAGGSASSAPYDLRFAFDATPGGSDVLDTLPLPRAVAFEADFGPSLGLVGTNPAAPFVLSVQSNGTEIGTVSVATDGSFSFSTNTGSAQIVPAGAVLTLVAPASADAAVANMSLTLAGSV